MTLILNGTDNSATTPAVTGTDTDTGIYYPAANQVAIATNGTQAMLVDSSQNITFAQAANLPNTFGFKNRIINGAMVIDQRNAGAAVTPTNNQFTLDRWRFFVSQTSKLTTQQNAGSVTPPAGFAKYLGITSSSAYSVGAGDYFNLMTSFESSTVYDFAWGTANAKTVTLSFWVYSSLTGTFGGAVRNWAYTRSYPFSYTISSANTWTQISVTITGDTSGTWVMDASNAGAIEVLFGLGVGSTYSGTAGSWAAANYLSATGATSVVGTNGATFYITGVQLEKGSTATSFDYRPYGTELALCLRYYQVLPGVVVNTSASWYSLTYATPMRASPTVSGGGAGFTITTASVYVGNFFQTTRTDQTLTFDAEL